MPGEVSSHSSGTWWKKGESPLARARGLNVYCNEIAALLARVISVNVDVS